MDRALGASAGDAPSGRPRTGKRTTSPPTSWVDLRTSTESSDLGGCPSSHRLALGACPWPAFRYVDRLTCIPRPGISAIAPKCCTASFSLVPQRLANPAQRAHPVGDDNPYPGLVTDRGLRARPCASFSRRRRLHQVRRSAPRSPRASLTVPSSSSSMSAEENHTPDTSDASAVGATARAAKTAHLPDPSLFPDPYPSHHHNVPALISSADSSSASTRSSAYTSFGSALAQHDYVHVHAGSDDSEHHPSSGVLDEAVRKALKYDSPTSPFPRSSVAEGEPGRWSGSDVDGGRESFGLRSRSSSVGRANQENSHPLRMMPSYDTSWQAVDERDELLMTSDDEDGDDILYEYDEDDNRDDDRTAAIVVAEQGRGLIVRGDNTPISKLEVQPGTTSGFTSLYASKLLA
jgi:hypothetical protein